jgi:CRP-like cAMP-binding protein
MADDGFNLALLMQLGGPVQNFKAGDTIFHEGDAGSEVFVVKSGRVEVRSGERLLDELSDHDLFGEMALVDASQPQSRQPTSRWSRSARSSSCTWSAKSRISRSR